MFVAKFTDNEIAALRHEGFIIAENNETARIEGASIALCRLDEQPDFDLTITLPNDTMICCTLRYDEIIAEDDA